MFSLLPMTVRPAATAIEKLIASSGLMTMVARSGVIV
jgi:hypothetical protein